MLDIHAIAVELINRLDEPQQEELRQYLRSGETISHDDIPPFYQDVFVDELKKLLEVCDDAG